MARILQADGTSIDVPDEEVAGNLAQGQWHQLDESKGPAKIQMVNRYGIPVEVDYTPDQVAPILGGGGRFKSGEEYRQEQVKADYGSTFGDELASFVTNALSGATFGLSDLAISDVGGEKARQALAGWREANPNAAMGGQITGAVAPIMLGGAPALAKGALKKGLDAIGGEAAEQVAGQAVKRGVVREIAGALPTSQLSKASAALEKSMTASLEKYAAGKGLGAFAAKVLPKVITQAGEGAVYGLGQSISEAALSDHEMAAEEYLANIGLGAALGGGIPLGAELFKGTVGKAVGGLKRRLFTPKTAGAVEELAGVEAKPGVVSKIQGMVTGNAPEDIQRFRGGGRAATEARHNAIQGDKILEKESFRFADDITARDQDFAKVAEYSRQFKPEQVRAQVKIGNEALTVDASEKMIDEGRRVVGEMQKAGATHYDGQAALKKIMDRLDEAAGIVEQRKAEIAGGLKVAEDPAFNASLFNEIENTKRFAGNQIHRISKVHNLGPTGAATVERLNDLYNSTLRRPLENPELWGDTLAKTQLESNEAWTRLLGLWEPRVQGGFTRLNKPVNMNEFHIVREGDQAGAHKFLTGLGTLEPTLEAKHYIQELENMRDVVRQHVKHYEMAPEAVAAADRMETTINSLQARISKAQKITQDQRVFGQIAKGKVGGMVGGVGGLLVGGPVGGVIGAGVGALLDPAGMIQKREILDRLIGGKASQALKSVGGKARAALDLAAPGARSAVTAGAVHAKEPARPDNKLELLQAAQDIPETARAMAGQIVVGQAITALDTSTRGTIKRQVGAVVSGKTSTAPATKAPGGDLALHNIGAKSHQAIFRAFEELVASPDELRERLGRSIAGLTGVLNQNTQRIAVAIEGKVQAAVQHLVDTAPRAPEPDGFDIVGNREPDIPRAELLAWFDRLRTVEHPLSVFDSIRDRSLSAEQAETLRTVYPRLQQQISQELLQASGDGAGPDKQVPYETAVQLSILAGYPVDSSMRPDRLAELQAAADGLTKESQAQEPGSQAAPRGRAGWGKLKASSAARTATESLLERKA